jgi:hypothetical protein
MQTLPNLPPAIAREVFATLCAALPPPATDTPDVRAARDEAAMAAVVALHPTDPLEAKLAADIVVAEAYAMDSFRLAGEFRNDLAATIKCRAQANTTLRQMRSLLREYRRTQAERNKALTAMHPAAMERAGYWFHEATVPEPAPPSAPSVAAEPAPPPNHVATEFESLSEAEQYAVLYADRAARIRAAGGLPPRLDFAPPEPEIVEALVNGTSPILRALDRHSAVTVAA